MTTNWLHTRMCWLSPLASSRLRSGCTTVNCSNPSNSVAAGCRGPWRGRAGHFGLSEASASTIRKAHAVHPVEAVQSENSLWSGDPEVEVLPVLEELGIEFVSYSPLGRGFLAGAFTANSTFTDGDFRSSNTRFQAMALEKNVSLLDALKQIAASKNATPGQLALAWLLTKKPWIVPIPGTRRRTRLEENIASAEISLTPADILAIESAVPENAIEGKRYSDNDLMMTNL